MTPATATFPRWTRIVAPAAALWYAFGLSQAVISFAADAAAAPALIWVSYAVACVAGIVGSAALYFNPARAVAPFAVSLVAAVIYFGWVYAFGAPTAESYGIGAVVIGVTLALLLVTRRL